MRFSTVFIVGFLFLSIFGVGGFFYYKINYGNVALNQQIENHLISVAEGKAQVLSFYLDERKEDLEFLSGSREVLDSLDLGNVNLDDNKMLSEFIRVNGYSDLFLVSREGKILFSLSDIKDVKSDEGLNAVYEKVQNDFGVGIFDPGYYGSDELSIFVTTPVLVQGVAKKKDVVGYLFLRINNSDVEKRVSEDIGFGDIGRAYVVNRDGGLVTQPKPGEVYSKPITTKMYKDCFQDYRNYYFLRSGQRVDPIDKSGEYENYLGKKVYGAHQYILQNSWCVLAEVDKKEFRGLIFNEEKKSLNNMAYGLVGVLLIIFIFIFILQKDIKVGGKK